MFMWHVSAHLQHSASLLMSSLLEHELPALARSPCFSTYSLRRETPSPCPILLKLHPCLPIALHPHLLSPASNTLPLASHPPCLLPPLPPKPTLPLSHRFVAALLKTAIERFIKSKQNPENEMNDVSDALERYDACSFSSSLRCPLVPTHPATRISPLMCLPSRPPPYLFRTPLPATPLPAPPPPATPPPAGSSPSTYTPPSPTQKAATAPARAPAQTRVSPASPSPSRGFQFPTPFAVKCATLLRCPRRCRHTRPRCGFSSPASPSSLTSAAAARRHSCPESARPGK